MALLIFVITFLVVFDLCGFDPYLYLLEVEKEQGREAAFVEALWVQVYLGG